jgi:phosphoribosylaminoimidazole carboxylase PurE protein
MRKVGIVMGSDSDMPIAQKAIERLEGYGIPYEVHIYSAHRTPEQAKDFAANAEENGFGVIIALAGKAAHLAGALAANSPLTMGEAFALALGIAIQNLPEGAVVASPEDSSGKAFGRGVLSGVVEPVGALLAWGLVSILTPLLPFILSFAAGTMAGVTVCELIPEAVSHKEGVPGTVGACFGFALMMALDMAL